jgi:hypothetical protein
MQRIFKGFARSCKRSYYGGQPFYACGVHKMNIVEWGELIDRVLEPCGLVLLAVARQPHVDVDEARYILP